MLSDIQIIYRPFIQSGPFCDHGCVGAVYWVGFDQSDEALQEHAAFGILRGNSDYTPVVWTVPDRMTSGTGNAL